ncbi:hypothetical protein [Sphingomonas sp. RS2018]
MDVFGLLSVGVTAFLFLGAALNAADLYMSVKPMSAGDLMIGSLGWIIATFGPIFLAIVFWRLAKRLQTAWVLHLLMLPSALTMLGAGRALMLSVTDTPDFDDTIGGPVIQATALLLSAVMGYYLAVVYTGLKRRSATANGS